MFVGMPVQAGVLQCLARLEDFFGSVYLTTQGRFGALMLAEEWASDDEKADLCREPVSELMWESASSGRVKCRRHGRGDAALALFGVPIHDEQMELVGAFGMCCPFISKEESLQVLAQFESVIGVLGLLLFDALNNEEGSEGAESERSLPAFQPSSLQHPVRLAFDLVAQVKNQFGMDLAALGFVRKSHVRVVAICGQDEVRASNPGVKAMRAAMEEALDLAKPVLWQEMSLEGRKEIDADHRLHRQWSHVAGGDTVASVPLYHGEECVAVLALRCNPIRELNWSELREIGHAAEQQAAVLPVARLAHRGPLQHLWDSARGAVRSLVGEGARRSASITALVCALVLWFAFGTLRFSLTVPASVIGASSRTISSPREGVLEQVLVEPGMQVREGQVLARLDAREDVLRRSELQAQIRTFEALMDRALAEGVPGQGRVLEAQLGELRAELAVVELRIQQAEIRATMAGLVLDGDLRARIGGRLTIGEALFTLTDSERLRVEMHIPERWYEAGSTCEQLAFAPSAHPTERVDLSNLRIAPSSETIADKNVFIGRSSDFAALEYLQPGMSGVTHLDLGPRPVWWVLSHRVLDWLRMRFWI